MKFKNNIKGVGSATLDRGISLVIAGVVLVGIIIGINWMYKQYALEKFTNTLNRLSINITEYYGEEYANINYTNFLKLYGKDGDYTATRFLDYPIFKGPASYTTAYEKARRPNEMGWLIDLANIDYDMCLTLGKTNIHNINYLFHFNKNARYPSSEFPVNDSSKITAFETFCEGINGGTLNKIGITFQ